MSKEKDILRAECSKDFDLPPCPHCGNKMYVEKIHEYRVAHFCKGGTHQVKTKFCKTPEEAVDLYLKGDYEYDFRYPWRHKQ